MKKVIGRIRNIVLQAGKKYRTMVIPALIVIIVILILTGMQRLGGFLAKLSLFDRLMLVILGISLCMKLGRSIVIPFYIKYLEFNSNRDCRFLIQNEEEYFQCENLRYFRKNFEDCGRQCSRKIGKLCWGFRALSVNDKNGETISGEDAVYSSPTILIIMGVVDWIIEFSTVILLIRTLVGIGGD